MAKIHAADVQVELDFAAELNAEQYDDEERSNAVIVFGNMSVPCIFDSNTNYLRRPNEMRYESADFFRKYVNYHGYVKMHSGEKYEFDYLDVSRYNEVTIKQEHYYSDDIYMEDDAYDFVPF